MRRLSENYFKETSSSRRLKIICIDEASGSYYCRQRWWLRKWGGENNLMLVNQIINRLLFGQHQRAIPINHMKNLHVQTALERINESQLNHRSLIRKLTQYLLLFLYINLFILLASSQVLYRRNESNNGSSSSSSYNDNNSNNINHANCNHRLPNELSRQQRQLHYRQHHYGPNLNERPHHSRATCRDCLAIPMVAVTDSEHINGFITPPIIRQTSGTMNENKQRLTNQAHQANQQISSYDALNLAQNLKNYYVREHDFHNHHHSFEPKSDENCPMTGILTVCDQINPYPADIILNRLDSAKKVLKQSYFNIDSLFSDERDHLSEPFEDLMGPSNVLGKSKRLKPTSGNVGSSRTTRFESGGEKVGKKKVNDDYMSTTLDSYDQNNNHDDRNYRQGRAITSFRGTPNEDFVDLVEKRAFSLSEAKLEKQEEVGKGSIIEITNPTTSKQDNLNTHTNGYLSSNERRENRERLSGPTLISNNTSLAIRLLSMSRRQTTNTTTSATTPFSTDTSKDQFLYEAQRQISKTFGGEEGQEEELAGEEEGEREGETSSQPSLTSALMKFDDLSGFSSNLNTLKTARKGLTIIQTRTINTVPHGRQHNSNSKYPNDNFNLRQRLRRQTSAAVDGPSGVNGDGNGTSLPAVEMSLEEGSQVDPDSVTNSVPSTFEETGSNNQQISEPICRAKSIYISPRAAVSINFLLPPLFRSST